MPVHDWATTQSRILWLLTSRFAGNKTAMATAIGLTHMAISRAVSGKRPPGSRLLRAIIERLAVDADWLLLGRGEPFPTTSASRLAGKRAPVSGQLLAGRVSADLDQVTELWIDTQGLLSPTQYWFVLSGGHPLLASERGFRAGDVILLETDPTCFPPQQKLWEKLCAVKRGGDPELGLVSYYEGSDENGPEYLEVEIFDARMPQQQTVDEFVFRRYPAGEVKSLHRRLVVEQGARGQRVVPRDRIASEPVAPRIRYGDIVAVWTGLLLRYGYARLS